jgi:hypothetical protein
MSDREAFERRLQDLERALRAQRRITAALACVVLVGFLAAFRSAEPEVVTARRFEVVDGEGRKVGAFGIEGSSTKQTGWHLQDPQSEALIEAWAGPIEDRSSGTKIPMAMLHAEGGLGVLHAFANEQGAAVHSYHDDVRSAGLEAGADRSALFLQSPPSGDSDEESVTVLRLSHTSGKPRIQGWDDKGDATIDLE